MSVLSEYRSESPFNVRDNAREIELKVIKICMNESYFPKRYRFVLVTDIINDAHKLVDCIEVANIIPLNKGMYDERLLYQKEAQAHLENIFRKMILAENLGFNIPEGTLKDLGIMLSKEERYIAGWIGSDKKRL